MPSDVSKTTSAPQMSCFCSAKPLPRGVRPIDSRLLGSTGDAVVQKRAAGASPLVLDFANLVFSVGRGKPFQVPRKNSTLCRKLAKENGIRLA